VRITPHVSFVGVHLFAHWLDQQDTFEPAVAQLQQAVETYNSILKFFVLDGLLR
jgi:hypothetical protein